MNILKRLRNLIPYLLMLLVTGLAIVFNNSTVWTLFFFVVPLGIISRFLFLFVPKSLQFPNIISTTHNGELVLIGATSRKFSFVPFKTQAYLHINDEVVPCDVIKYKDSTIVLSFNPFTISRGDYKNVSLDIIYEDPFGVFSRKHSYRHTETLLVEPELTPLYSSMISEQLSQKYSNSQHLAIIETSDIRGIRDYVAGDRVNLIDWKSSAKANTIFVKQMERKALKPMRLCYYGMKHPNDELALACFYNTINLPKVTDLFETVLICQQIVYNPTLQDILSYSPPQSLVNFAFESSDFIISASPIERLPQDVINVVIETKAILLYTRSGNSIREEVLHEIS